jgi:hypothetical protein
MGTRDEEKGEAPEEYGTFGLLVPLRVAVPFPNEAMKEPVIKKLSPFELEVIDFTSACAPATPLKGALDQLFAFGSKTAIEPPGDENFPPAQTLLSTVSQYREWISPLGPLEPTCEKEPEEGW